MMAALAAYAIARLRAAFWRPVHDLVAWRYDRALEALIRRAQQLRAART